MKDNNERARLLRNDRNKRWRARNPSYFSEYYHKNIKKERNRAKVRQRIWRRQNKEKWRKIMREYYQRLKAKFVKMLGSTCSNCGYNKSLCALTFHHLDNGSKESNHDYYKSKAFEQKILEGKIQLLCANCHLELHHEK